MIDFAKVSSKISSFKIPVVLFLVGLFLFSVGVGLFAFRFDGASEVQVVNFQGEVAGERQREEIIVDVDGAVLRPGVYKIKADSRVNEAISAAGGLSTDADSARINLASKVSDGQKVLVPSKLQSTNDQLQKGGGEVVSQKRSGLVSINSASEGQLDTLPGVGPVTAGKIINGRPYSSVDELLSKKIVTKSVFEKIKDLVSI